MLFQSLTILSIAVSVFAAPSTSAKALSPRANGWNEEVASETTKALKDFATPTHWAAGGSLNYTAHDSCNATQKRLIGDGLEEALVLLNHARAHIRRFGNDSL